MWPASRSRSNHSESSTCPVIEIDGGTRHLRRVPPMSAHARTACRTAATLHSTTESPTLPYLDNHRAPARHPSLGMPRCGLRVNGRRIETLCCEDAPFGGTGTPATREGAVCDDDIHEISAGRRLVLGRVARPIRFRRLRWRLIIPVFGDTELHTDSRRFQSKSRYRRKPRHFHLEIDAGQRL